MAVCSCVKEQLPTGGFGRGYINPVVSLAGETTKSSGFPEGRYMGSCAMEGVDSDSLYISVYEYDNTDLPYGLMEEEPLTKGRVTTKESINATGQQFTLDAWLESENRYDGSQDGDGRVYITTDKDNWHIMDGVTVERGTSGWCYTSGLEYPWRNQVATNFWSVYPVSVSGRSITRPTDTATDAQQKALTFSYALPAACSSAPYKDAENQPDLCFAYNTKTWSDGDDNKINIQFHHALSAVYFRVEDVIDGVTVRQIGFDDVLSSGVCDVTGNTDNTPSFEWRDRTQPEDYTQDYVHSTDFSDANDTQPFTGNDKIYMMIPQTLSSGTKLRAQFKLSDNSIVTRTADISKFSDGTSVEWKPGKKYLYKLSANNIDFDYTLSIDSTSVNFIPTAWPPFRDLSIDSYKKKKGTTDIRPVAWKVVKYSTDGGTTWHNYDWTDATTPTPIDWTSMRTNFRYGFGGIGGYPSSSWFAVYPAFEPQIVYTPYTNALRGKGTRGSSTSPWDLSTHTASGADCNMSTANCYIVDRAGTYKLPLVYGPSIYGGQTIASTYTSACAAEGNVFVNHLGNPIEKPLIYQNTGCENIKDAVLVYQDVEGIISGVELCDSGHYLKFNVESANLQQCNAIVAVRDNHDRIMWSWHIWVTAEDYSITKRLGSTDFALMNLGTVRPAKETRYQRREARVVFRQDESGLQDTLTIVQLPLTIPEYETCPTYQWGRKDPILRGLNPAGEAHCYTTEGTDVGTYTFAISNSNVPTATAIQHPQIIYTGNPADSTEWNSGSHLKILWNNQANPDFEPSDVVKTVYDPSPVGFCVPIFNAAFGLLKDVDAFTYSSTDPSEFNGIFIDKGFNAACSPTDTLFFPFSGCRICGGGYLRYYGSIGQWWTADRLTNPNPLCFSIYKIYKETNGPGIIRRSFWSKAANAYAVRPMKYTP